VNSIAASPHFSVRPNGAVTDTYDYDAFGNLVNSTGSTPDRYMYQGEQWDADLNAYYLRARYYDPAARRFLNMDPALGADDTERAQHPYLYGGGDPVNQGGPERRGVRAGSGDVAGADGRQPASAADDFDQ